MTLFRLSAACPSYAAIEAYAIGPGVYRMIDARGDPIYVGKAVS